MSVRAGVVDVLFRGDFSDLNAQLAAMDKRFAETGSRLGGMQIPTTPMDDWVTAGARAGDTLEGVARIGTGTERALSRVSFSLSRMAETGAIAGFNLRGLEFGLMRLMPGAGIALLGITSLIEGISLLHKETAAGDDTWKKYLESMAVAGPTRTAGETIAELTQKVQQLRWEAEHPPGGGQWATPWWSVGDLIHQAKWGGFAMGGGPAMGQRRELTAQADDAARVLLMDQIHQHITTAHADQDKANQDAQERYKANEKAIADLQAEAAMFGQSKTVIELYALARRGATATEMEAARVALLSKDAQQQLADTLKGIAELRVTMPAEPDLTNLMKTPETAAERLYRLREAAGLHFLNDRSTGDVAELDTWSNRLRQDGEHAGRELIEGLIAGTGSMEQTLKRALARIVSDEIMAALFPKKGRSAEEGAEGGGGGGGGRAPMLTAQAAGEAADWGANLARDFHRRLAGGAGRMGLTAPEDFLAPAGSVNLEGAGAPPPIVHHHTWNVRAWDGESVVNTLQQYRGLFMNMHMQSLEESSALRDAQRRAIE